MTEVAENASIQGAKVDSKNKNAEASLIFPVDIGAILKDAASDWLEKESGIMEHIANRISEEAMKLRPNHITVDGVKTVEIKARMHKDFKEALHLIRIEKNLYLAGAAGCGKTTLAEQIAQSLSLQFGHLSCTSGMSEAHVLGRMVADGSYIKSSFVDIYENGGVFLFDEIDAADANTLLIINSALANGHMSVPNRKESPIARRHKDFYCVCAANTWGTGSNEYAGRNLLDAAFLDRFAGSRMLIEYDTNLENDICGNRNDLFHVLKKIRANVVKYKIRRVVSTRAFVSGTRALANGKSLDQFIDRFMTGWTKEEKKKAMEAGS